MKFLAVFVALIFAASSFADDSDVLTLDATNFEKTLKDNSLILIEFYAPWCGHCKHLAPEWEKAATSLKEKDVNAKLAKIDADDNQNAEIRQTYDIRGFPTLKLFRDGVFHSDYQGERTADAIANFMRKQASPASTILSTLADAETFRDAERVVVIGFFENTESAEYQSFRKVANLLRDNYSFGEVIGATDINTALEAGATPSVVLFKKFDEKRHDFTDLTNEDAFATFVKSNSVPLIDEIGPHNFKVYVDAGIPLAYVFVDLSKEGQQEEITGHIEDLAKSTKGRMNWVLIDWAKYAKHSERLGLSGNVVPAIAIENLADGTHYVFDEKTTLAKDPITTWINEYLDGKIQPTIKSEPIPEDNNGPVKVLVANNFNEIVNDKTKDVFVEFYAPWCGHCKKLTPIFEELGTALASHKDVIIAKIDATANDISPKFGVRGFPTLKLFPANNKETPIDYEGDRSLDDMQAFILSNAVSVSNTRDEL